MEGMVMKSTGSWYVVRSIEGRLIQCRIKGAFRIKGIKSTNPVAVGDLVDYEMEEGADTGLIQHIHDRKNYIIRKSVNLSKQVHIIAANIDQAFLIVTMIAPPTHTGFIDRFLVTAEAYSIPVVLLFNKTDLHTAAEQEQMEYLHAVYEPIGYRCIALSAKEKINTDAVAALMKGKVSLISGNSGAGKSTLINAIDPDLKLRTAAISEYHQAGQHTTTFAEMFELNSGGFVIDTPGIKGFGLVDMDPDEVDDYFPEFLALKEACKFNNCKHLDEPKCAIKQAVEQGEIAFSRFESYLSFMEEDSGPYRQNMYKG